MLEWVILLVLGGAIFFTGLFLVRWLFSMFAGWLRLKLVGADISALKIIGMILRGNPPRLLMMAYILAYTQNRKVDLNLVESVYIENKFAAPDSFTLSKMALERLAKSSDDA
ncbi:MAG: hypothetical protein ACYS18_04100 [Planctomycetota bacterium]|jgi:hypothetical protein